MRSCFVVSINRDLLHQFNYMKRDKAPPVNHVYFNYHDAQKHIRDIPPPEFVYPLAGFSYLHGVLMQDGFDEDDSESEELKILSLRELVFLCRRWEISDPSPKLRAAMQQQEWWQISLEINRILEAWWYVAKNEMSPQQRLEFWRFLERNPYEITEVELV